MPYTLTVSPDFSPRHIAGWYIFNTWLQQQLDLHIHLELFNSFAEQRAAIERGDIDLIFANPYDASMLVREHGFSSLAAPKNKADECIIATAADSDIESIEDLKEGTRIASTDDPDVHLMGMIMIEPADLNAENTERVVVDSYPIVAKKLFTGQADIGFFLDDAFDDFSKLLKSDLRELIRSQIYIIRHLFLVSPRLEDHKDEFIKTLMSMHETPKGADVLENMNLQGWDAQSEEDTEFMIDLMATLNN